MNDYTLQFKAPSSLSPGSYDDTVTITACYDGACLQQVTNSPQTVSVSFVVNESAGVAPQIAALGPNTVNAGTRSVGQRTDVRFFLPSDYKE